MRGALRLLRRLGAFAFAAGALTAGSAAAGADGCAAPLSHSAKGFAGSALRAGCASCAGRRAGRGCCTGMRVRSGALSAAGRRGRSLLASRAGTRRVFPGPFAWLPPVRTRLPIVRPGRDFLAGRSSKSSASALLTVLYSRLKRM